MPEPRLTAFVRTYDGLFKVYDQGQDWQIIGPGFERWTSQWAADVKGSLKRAVSLIPGADLEAVTYT